MVVPDDIAEDVLLKKLFSMLIVDPLTSIPFPSVRDEIPLFVTVTAPVPTSTFIPVPAIIDVTPEFFICAFPEL